MTEPESRYVYLVRGGSPVALRLAEVLDDPEVRAELEERARAAYEQLGRLVEDLLAALAPAMVDLGRQLQSVYANLREAGVLPEVPPEDPRARALWL